MATKLVALTKVPYNKRSYQAGEEFEASANDAKVLVAIGSCKIAITAKQPVQVVVEPVVESAALKEEDEVIVVGAKPTKNNSYKHRSLQSEKTR